MTEPNPDIARFNMIEQQVRPWDVLDQRVLDVLREVPREDFVPEDKRALAFMDLAIPIGHGEAMFPPKLEGRLLQALALRPGDRVLEVGTGSGFLTACLARLAGQVLSVDIHEDFTERAGQRLTDHGIDNVTLETGDAAWGWRHGELEFDAIAVTGAVAEYDTRFEEQLTVGGRLFIIVGRAPVMEAMLVTRTGPEAFDRTGLFETSVKHLLGREPRPGFVL